MLQSGRFLDVEDLFYLGDAGFCHIWGTIVLCQVERAKINKKYLQCFSHVYIHISSKGGT